MANKKKQAPAEAAIDYKLKKLDLQSAEVALGRIEVNKDKELIEHPKRLLDFDARIEKKQREIDRLRNEVTDLKKKYDLED